MAEIEELRKRIDELTKQAETLQRRISLLPVEHPLRRQTETSLASIRKELEKTKAALTRAEAEAMPREIRAVREELEALTKDLSKRFVELEATILTAPVGIPERARRMAEEIDTLRDRIAAATLAIGYGMPMGMAWKRLYEDRLWDGRMERGEVEITERSYVVL